MDLAGKNVAVTGAGRGLGAAIAKRLGQLGATLALIDMDQELLAHTRAEFESMGIEARSYVANVVDEAAVQNVFAEILDDTSRLDGLVNNAGIVRDGLLVKAKDGRVERKLSLAHWQAVIDVNLTGVFLCGREAASSMIQCGNGGVIVNISSLSRAGNMGQSNYSAAKAGVHALTVVWAKELARYRIRTGSIAPGFIETEMTQSIREDVRDKIKKTIPLTDMGQPEHIAHGVQFVFEHDYFTGRCLEIDGGMRL